MVFSMFQHARTVSRKSRIRIRLVWVFIVTGLLVCIPLNWFPASAQQVDSAWSQPLRLGITSVGQANADPTIVSDSAGWLHVFWLDVIDGNTGSSYIMYTRWDGRSWSEPIDILMSPEPGHVTHRPRAGIGWDGRIHVIWWSLFGYIYQSSAPLHSADTAAGWSKPTPIPLPSLSTYPNLLVDRSGRFHLLYQDWPTQSPHYMYSDDSGQTWSESKTIAICDDIEQMGINPENYMAIDGRGRIHVVWRRSTNQTDYSRSEDGGQTWSESMRLEPIPGNEADATFAATVGTRGDDEIHLVWSGSYYLMPDGSLRATKKYHKWSTDGGHTWTPTELAWENITGNNGHNPMVVDATGKLHTIVVSGYGPEAVTWVLYSQWMGDRWSPFVALPETGRDDWNNFGAIWHDMVLSEGNRLNAVWQTRDGDIWYATRQIDAPYIPPQPVPTAVAPTVASTLPQVSPTGTFTTEAKFVPTVLSPYFSQAGESGSSNPNLPIVAAVLSTVLLLAFVVILSLVRRPSR
jgi:hypothetical protein